jgi:hypothetical protein
MMEVSRTTGCLPVREHLRPRPDLRDAIQCWVASRDENGCLQFDEVYPNEAASLPVEGEA